MASAMRTPQRMFTVYDYSNDGDFFQETAAHHAVSAHDAYLAHLHGGERILMALRRPHQRSRKHRLKWASLEMPP